STATPVTPIHSVHAWLESFSPSEQVTLAVLQNFPGVFDIILTLRLRCWPTPNGPMFQVAVLPLILPPCAETIEVSSAALSLTTTPVSGVSPVLETSMS